MELSQGKTGKIIVKEVIRMKDKTIIYYTAEGISPYSQSSCLYLRDENNKPVEAHDGFNIRKNQDNPNEYSQEFDALDSSKKYKLVTQSFDDYDIREDLKFKIPLEK